MNEVVHTSPTIGSNVEEIVVKNTHFLMWDIGGQESLRSSWNTYYSNTEVRTFFKLFCFFLLLSFGFLPERGSWRVCSEHRRRQGPPPSQRSASHKGLCRRSKAGVRRGRCVRELEQIFTAEPQKCKGTFTRNGIFHRWSTLANHSCHRLRFLTICEPKAAERSLVIFIEPILNQPIVMFSAFFLHVIFIEFIILL